MKRVGILYLLIFAIIIVNAEDSVRYDMTVAQDGTGDYASIQDAVDATKAFPDRRIIIFIKNGIYHEKVRIPSWNNMLSMIGENAEKTIITWDDYFDKIARGRNSTFFTFTLKVEADDFYAENLTIENSAGEVGQAVALHVEGDRCVFKHCRLKGNQDTVYINGEKSRHLFENCQIEGTTDFIFGSATAVFSKCEIISKKDSYITAASTNKGKPFGFVFINCNLLAKDGTEKVYLGRPWRIYAKTVFIKCNMGRHILLVGWHNWDKTEAESTTFYAEYKSTGAGVNTGERVGWSHNLTDKEAQNYTIDNILGNWVLEYVTY